MISNLVLFIGLLAGIITIIEKLNKHLPFFIRPRIKSINGRWIGTMEQRKNKSSYSSPVPVSLSLKTTRKTVFGTAQYIIDKTEASREISINGSFHDDNHLYLQYKNDDNAATQHGRILLKLSGDALTASGEYVGIGILKGEVISGHVKLEKQQNDKTP